MRNVLSFPTVRASFPEGCTATAFTRPLCPFSARRTAQSRARNRHRDPSSEAERRYERDGKLKCVMEPSHFGWLCTSKLMGQAYGPSWCMSPPTSFFRLRSQILMISSALPVASHFPPCGEAATALIHDTCAGKMKSGLRWYSSLPPSVMEVEPVSP